MVSHQQMLFLLVLVLLPYCIIHHQPPSSLPLHILQNYNNDHKTRKVRLYADLDAHTQQEGGALGTAVSHKIGKIFILL